MGFLFSPGGFHKGILKLIAPFREEMDFQKNKRLMSKRIKPNCFGIVCPGLNRKATDSEKAGRSRVRWMVTVCPAQAGASQVAPVKGAQVLSLHTLASVHPTLLPVLFHFLHGLVGVSRTLVSGVHIGLVNGEQSLFDVILHRRHCSADGLAAKAVSYQTEMRQAVLYVRLQDWSGPAVPVGCAILNQEVCEFFAHLPVETVSR